MVKVLPKNDELRKLLKHPSGNIKFRDEGPIDWPDDSFTHRRLVDGDVTLYEEAPKAEAIPAPEPTVQAGEAPVEQSAEEDSTPRRKR